MSDSSTCDQEIGTPVIDTAPPDGLVQVFGRLPSTLLQENVSLYCNTSRPNVITSRLAIRSEIAQQSLYVRNARGNKETKEEVVRQEEREEETAMYQTDVLSQKGAGQAIKVISSCTGPGTSAVSFTPRY